jgi:hypothetical protein
MIKQSISSSLIMILAIAILFVTGCTQGYTSNKDYNTGKEGLVVEFSTSNPTNVYELEEFGSYITINNKGSYDVKSDNPGRLLISYDTYRLQSQGANGTVVLNKIYLQGKSIVYPVGEDYPFEVYFKSQPLTHLRESSATSINYNLCYPYSTTLATMTCIDTKTASRSVVNSACTVENYNGGSGQGAPIVITKIEPEILLQDKFVRPQFKIYIENLGDGYVTNSPSCAVADITDVQTSGKVNVRAWLSGKVVGKELQCGPVETSGVIRLVDSSTYIRCYLNTSIEGYAVSKQSYVAPLIVELQYTYENIYKQDITILRNNVLESNLTKPLCETYQTPYNGKCISTCDFCAMNPDANQCHGQAPFQDFIVRENFSCSCQIDVCNAKESKGGCIKGYCAGDLYCCSTKVCGKAQVEYQGQCIDKCYYCAHDNSDGSDTINCAYGFNFTNLQCSNINITQCNKLAGQKACIQGYCGGDHISMYCADTSNLTI